MRGRASGIVVMALFGAVWWAVGSGALTGAARGLALAVGGSVSLLLLAGWWRLRRSLPAEALGGPADTSGSRRFGAVNAAQWIAIVLVVVVARAVDRPEIIPALVCLVVGAHFFPLAGLFDAPRYRLTGGALVAVAAATLLAVPALGLPGGAWRAAPCFGAALVLWATSASWVAHVRQA